MLQEVEPLVPGDAIYRVEHEHDSRSREIAEAAQRPDRVLGMHFFSPVHKMPLLEVIVTPETARDATVTAVAYGKKLGKTVIVVNDGPGFYTTRILSAYMNEAGRLLDEGAPIDAIDRRWSTSASRSARSRCSTRSGIDVGGKVGAVMAEAFGARMMPGGGRCGAWSSPGAPDGRGAAASTCTTRRGRRARSTRPSTS